MGKIFNAIAVVTAGTGLLILGKKAREKAAEEKRRKSICCSFNDGISQNEFNDIVCLSIKNIKRLSETHIDGAILYGTVLSKSGISTWRFSIDFNDYGHITGRYWVSSDNNDSDIPLAIANRIKTYIEQKLLQ